MTPADKILNALARIEQCKGAVSAAECDVIRAKEAVKTCKEVLKDSDAEVIRVIKSAGWANKRIIDATGRIELFYDDVKDELTWQEFDGVVLDSSKLTGNRKKSKGSKGSKAA